jgi:hypothetical protein
MPRLYHDGVYEYQRDGVADSNSSCCGCPITRYSVPFFHYAQLCHLPVPRTPCAHSWRIFLCPSEHTFRGATCRSLQVEYVSKEEVKRRKISDEEAEARADSLQ